MTPSHTAQGLASLGRNGDSMLMHVSPSEVEGLSALGKMTGHKLHTNPHTGMPEAFDFGSFLASLLPTAAGFMMGGPAGAALGIKAGTTAATLAPIAAGMVTGAAVAGVKGDDMLTGTLMGGLGGYGGGNLAGTFGKMGANTAAQTAQEAIKGGYVPGTVEGANVGLQSQIMPASMTASAPAIAPTVGENIMSGVSQFAADPMGKGYEAFKTAGGSAFDLAAPVGMAGVAGVQEDMYPEADTSLEEKRKAEENKYRDPRTGLLNLTQASPNLRLFANGGIVSNPSVGGGLSDLYNRPEGQNTETVSQDGYGIGRLNSLANAESMNAAKTLGYAMGGPIAFAAGGDHGYLDGAGDGMSDSIPATIEGKQPARLADGEFVIPADVVSHIGNGSSKAGSKQLYAMLDRIRKARTGHTKQGKEIKPNKYMPA